MTMPSRGISPIQEKARGSKMKKDQVKKMDIKKSKISVKKPFDSMSVGAASSLPMGSATGMKAGGSACKGMYKGGKVDGCISKGRTKGKIV
jgi:hypothetical protein